MRAGDGFEGFDAGELALERAVMVETGAVDDLDGTVNPEPIAGEPDLTVGARGDGTDQFVLGNDGQTQDLRLSGWAAGTHAWLRASINAQWRGCPALLTAQAPPAEPVLCSEAPRAGCR